MFTNPTNRPTSTYVSYQQASEPVKQLTAAEKFKLEMGHKPKQAPEPVKQLTAAEQFRLDMGHKPKQASPSKNMTEKEKLK